MRWIAAFCGFCVLAVVALVGVVRLERSPATEWKEFSIGPAAGWSLTINPGVVRGSGAQLSDLVAWVYGFQTARLTGPDALYTRYSIAAVAPEADLDLLRTLLRRELETRFRLETHVAARPFAVWVLTATAHPTLTPGGAKGPTTSIFDRNARIVGAPIGTVAGALQSILGRPVVDETGIAGNYDLEFAWGEMWEQSIVTVMREKFGLILTPGKRTLDSLIVDRVEPDLAMTVVSGVGRLTQRAHPGLRTTIARWFTVR